MEIKTNIVVETVNGIPRNIKTFAGKEGLYEASCYIFRRAKALNDKIMDCDVQELLDVCDSIIVDGNTTLYLEES